MHQRKQAVLLVKQKKVSVSEAARRFGVSRNTIRFWLKRAEEQGLEKLSELSRRPRAMPRKVCCEFEQRLLSLKSERPVWGAKKLLAKLWPEDPPLSLRTADRILKRNGQVRVRTKEVEASLRFEKERCNQLLQIDFKGISRRRVPYSPLSVLDDHSRFCLAFAPLPDHRTASVFGLLWDLFGEFGLPEAILTDNESCFAGIPRIGPTWLEAHLWLLGIRTSHGRPFHPQTQGKVERFHLTANIELGAAIYQPTLEDAARAFAAFKHFYNYERPHEALNQRMPGEIYTRSERIRPDQIPPHYIPEGAIARKVDHSGLFRYRMKRYRAGEGLRGQYVELRGEQSGIGLYFAGKRFAGLEEVEV